MAIVCSVSLSTMNILSYEFFKGIWYGSVVDERVYEADDIDCVECLWKVYCCECCVVGWSFLIEAGDDGVYDGV